MAKTNRTISYDIRGNTKHFNVHMNEAAESVKKFRKTAESSTNSTNKFSSALSRAASGAAVFHGPLSGVSGRLSAMATVAKSTSGALVVLGTGFTAFAKVMKDGYDAAAETEHQLARLEGVFKATGYASGQTAESVDRFARNLARNTLTSTEEVRAAAAALGTFTTIMGDDFERVLSLGQDMSEVIGGSLQGSVMQLAKALDAPTLGMNSLRRAGVSFTNQQREQIKHLEKTGQLFQAQEVVMKAVEAQLKGVGEEVARQSAVGGWDTLGQNIKEFVEASFNAVIGLDKVKGALNSFNNWLEAQNKKIDFGLMTDEEVEAGFMAQAKAIEEIQEKQGKALATARHKHAQLNRELEDAYELQDKYGEELAKRTLGRYEKEEAEEKARAARAKRIAEEKAAYNKRVAQEQIEIQQKLDKMTGASDVTAAVTREDKVVAQYKLRFEAMEAYRQQVLEEHGTLLGMEQEFEEALTDLKVNMARERNEAILADEEDVQKMFDKLQKDKDKRDLEAYEKQQTFRANTAAGVESMFGSMASAMKEGSKAQKSMLVLEKAAAIARVSFSMSIAMAKALEKGFPAGAVEMASAAAMGAQILANLVSMSTIGSRASGGPVSPGGRYMVGEHGPEILQMGTGSGTIIKNEDISPNVNVNIVESAERAGSVEQEGNTIDVFVAAAMSRLNNDLNSGRGLFAAVENRYGLQR